MAKVDKFLRNKSLKNKAGKRLSSQRAKTLDNKVTINEEPSYNLIKTHLIPISNQDAIAEYIDLFTSNNSKDMLSYAYMEASHYYDDLLRHSSDYYLFRDEVSIIKENKKALEKYLTNITDIMEIGPGSDYALENKTLPILTCAPNLNHYHAIDISPNYLHDIGQFMKKNTDDLTISLMKVDFIAPDQINLPQVQNQKAILFLGSTLGNLQSSICLKNISYMSNKNDIFIFTVDTNHDEESLIKAYSGDTFNNLIKGILRFFGKLNLAFNNLIDKFEVKTVWDSQSETVKASFIVTENCSFQIENSLIIVLKKGQEFETVRSRKFTEKEMSGNLENFSFEVLEILRFSKMSMFVARKI